MKELTEETVGIPSPAGRLEGMFGYDARATPGRGVLLLSPHPSYGGDLGNNVIAGAASVFVEGGFSALRFNYHGVGRSEGGPDDPLERLRYWSERLESDDAEAALVDGIAALDWLASRCSEVHAFGYSYGAIIALRLAATRSEICSIAAVGLAAAGHALDFLRRVSCPVLSIHGDRDFATTVETVDAVLARIPSSTRRVVLDERDHFFRGEEREVAATARSFFEEHSGRRDAVGASRPAHGREAR